MICYYKHSNIRIMSTQKQYDATYMILLLLRQEKERLLRKNTQPGISRMQRELMNNEDLKKSKNNEIDQSIIEIEQTYKLVELKELRIKNYIPMGDVVGHKGHKRTWAKAIRKTTKWGFNTFVVGMKNNKNSQLCGQIDVLLHIQKFM